MDDHIYTYCDFKTEIDKLIEKVPVTYQSNMIEQLISDLRKEFYDSEMELQIEELENKVKELEEQIEEKDQAIRDLEEKLK